jgi:hypothetical protein
MFTGESGAVAASKMRIWATFSPRKVILVATIRYRYTMRSVEVELSQYGVCSTVAERSRLVLVGLNHYYLALASAVRLIDTHYTDLLRSYACIPTGETILTMQTRLKSTTTSVECHARSLGRRGCRSAYANRCLVAKVTSMDYQTQDEDAQTHIHSQPLVRLDFHERT